MKLQPQPRARQPRAPLPRDIHYCHPVSVGCLYADTEVRVFSGLGPRWRLLRACQKGIACPRCGDGPCLSRPVCLERLWAYAAQRRREKTDPRVLATIRDGLATTPATSPTAEDILNAAIDHGLVRLERIKDSTEVQWVDAV